jgi:hypothetical protein
VVCEGIVCDALPHVRDGAVVECRDGRCVIPPDGCEDLFADCTPNADDGCESDITDESSCGACDVACDAASPICTIVDGTWACGSACIAETPTFCGRCVNLSRDLRACGSCDTDCTLAHAPVACVEGTCELTSTECDFGYADCNDGFGCETQLSEPSNCGACGRDCSLPHTVADCSRADACGAPSCEPGFANCDRDSADCETPFGDGCSPVLAGFTSLPGDIAIKAVAYAADGSYAIGGAIYGTQDLDPGPTVEEHVAPEQGAFVSWYSASGEYIASISFGAELLANVDELAATSDGGFLTLGIDDDGKFVSKLSPERAIVWTRHFDPNAEPNALAASANDGAIVAGRFQAEADLDPGPGETIVVNEWVVVDNVFVAVLDSDGDFVWGRAVADTTLSSPCSVGVTALSGAADGNVYVLGSAFGFCESGGEAFDGGYLYTYSPTGALVARAMPSIPEPKTAVLRADGSLDVGGMLSARFDFDGGAAVVERSNHDGIADGYLMRIGPANDFERVNVFPHAVPTLLAPFSDGATLAVLGSDEVHAFDSDATDLFAFRVDNGFTAVAARDTEFLLAGEALAATDLDPGPAEVLAPEGAYVARYRR